MGIFVNLIGQIFGQLEVIERIPNLYNRVAWKCKCSCGNIHNTTSIHLKSGSTKSCGCLKKKMMSERRSLDLLGQRFGMLLVIEKDKVGTSGALRWKCLCDCGGEKIINGNSLKQGLSNSCGCLRIRKRVTYSTDNNLYNGYKYRANRRLFEFEIPKEIFVKMIYSPCFYCDNNTNRNSIDRVDSNIGYLMNNIVPCCLKCNIAKSDMSFEEFCNYLSRFNGITSEYLKQKLNVLNNCRMDGE